MGKYSQKEVSKESQFVTKLIDSMNNELDDYLNKIINNLRMEMNKPADIYSLDYLFWSIKYLGLVPFVEEEEKPYFLCNQNIKVVSPMPTILTNLTPA